MPCLWRYIEPWRHVLEATNPGPLSFLGTSKQILILPKPERSRFRLWTLHAIAGYRDGHAAQEPFAECVEALLDVSDARAWRRRQARTSDMAGGTLLTAFRA